MLIRSSIRVPRRSFNLFAKNPQFPKVRPIRQFHSSAPLHLEPRLPQEKKSSCCYVLEKLGMACAASMFAGTGYMLYNYGMKEREIPIIGSYVDLTKDDHCGLIVSGKKFRTIGDKVKQLKGDLSGSIVENLENHCVYLKKGAIDHLNLIEELIIADFLNMLRPNEQPRGLIIEEMQESGQARFYTLSEMQPNSMDLEDFLLKVKWKEELEKVRMIGLGEALAAKMAFGTELKLANLLVTKKKDEQGQDVYVVTAIDHERAAVGFLGNDMFTSDPNTMIDQIKDFHAFDQEMNNTPLAGSLVALQFRDYVLERELIKESDVVEFYKKMINVNPTKMDKIMHALDGGNGVMTHEERERFKYLIEKVQQRAHDFLVKNNHIQIMEERSKTHAI